MFMPTYKPWMCGLLFCVVYTSRSVTFPQLSYRLRQRCFAIGCSLYKCPRPMPRHVCACSRVDRFPSETVSWRDCPGRTDGVPEIDLLAVDFHAWLMPWVVQLYNSCCGFFIAIFRFCIYGCCCGEWFNRVFCACNILIVWDSIYVDSSLFEENN